jgi:putative PEP-CTERM system histidine kinase
VGRQVASYLAAQESARALAEARQFEAFNRRFAFVLHDIKNLVSQLSLMVANAEKHADNPEFQKDMMATVQESVTKMKALLERLHSETDRQAEDQTDIGAVLEEVVGRKRQTGQELTLHRPQETLWVRGEPERLTNVFEHLVQNAVDAVDGNGRVEVRVVDQEASVRVEVADTGPGMDPEFIRNHLFRPFRSKKSGGYGIGAYESRQIVLEAGGSLDVHSKVGEGTTVLINLRKVASSSSRPESETTSHGGELESQ